MKKTYIIPTVNLVEVTNVLPIAGSLTADRATFYDTDATGEGMAKGSSSSRYNVWDDDWSAE